MTGWRQKTFKPRSNDSLSSQSSSRCALTQIVVDRSSEHRPNGEDHVWWRCDDCHINLLGPGYWVPHDYLTEHSVDVSTLEVIQDQRRRTPPCRVCGKRGAELHHWAPRHLFGAEADLWPTDYLCKSCHQLWHHHVENALVQDLDLLRQSADDQSGLSPRRTA